MNAAAPRLQPLDLGLPWQNRFHDLGPAFYTPQAPWPLPDPHWVAISTPAAQALGLRAEHLSSDGLLHALAGNRPICGTRPLASVYSGHQFGNWAGQLGDGRALLLGEANGWEVQLKGSGQTPYSRMGDGRAVLRSSIREFLASEAMHALGVPTTRALCVVGSGEPVRRETLETAAVVTRLAPSFIRFGHFEHFCWRGQHTELRRLADFAIEHFYPQALAEQSPYATFLEAVVARTAALVAHWQAVGFCHGVLNTDNMSILGLTLDYGPFQFMDAFDPGHICNHTDRSGRYAFDQQPSVCHWNLYALAHALLPLIQDEAAAQRALDAFEPAFEAALHQRLCDKLGLPTSSPERLWQQLLGLLAQDRVDYPIFWRRLSLGVASGDFASVADLFIHRRDWATWLLSYQELLAQQPQGLSAELMLKINPWLVLRNHLAQTAIEAAQQGDFSPTQRLLAALQAPFAHPTEDPGGYGDFPPDWAASLSLSCSS
jgi:uncharacterized protein YdiU (UPF0061 family)